MREEILKIIPKTQDYIQYIIDLIIKIPRTEKYSIGSEYKQSTYRMLNSILYLNKVDTKEKIKYLNTIDVELNTQRIYLRIMQKNKWIDIKKFNITIEKISEIGKILGGLIKYYGKNNKE